MAARSSLQLSVFFILFLVFWRIQSRIWRCVSALTLLVFVVYYKSWSFEATHGELWVDAGVATACAIAASFFVPKPDENSACGICYFFVLFAVPVALLHYADAFVPQTGFAVGIYLSAMVVAALCTLHDITCPKSYNLHVVRPATVFLWAMIAPDIRFFPVPMALAVTILSVFLVPPKRKRKPPPSSPLPQQTAAPARNKPHRFVLFDH